ncbi:PREDICTED: uncharacterized protein LOC108746156 [Trachymyrmex septentrionalis]|uniref:uncharacterized protein LOC108746156 n=1 Tax=Trachymyrmex septentrionalis TaxID=34720 RepID=UPI00084F4696|nr:PREDICTED: uncharacterized protein LOC108746156 [Trachymyrmex septentrionalis]
MDIERTDQTMPKLLRVIAAKRSRVLPIVVTTDSKPQQFEVLSVPAKKITTHIDQKKLSEKKVTLQEHSPVEVTKEIKADIVITPEMNVAAVEDALKDVADENRVSQDILNDTTRTYVACPQKKPEGKLQKLILCKCGLPSDSNGCLCSIAKYMKDRVPCPQKKLEEEPQKSALCTRELLSNSNNYLYSIVKCTKCNNIIDNCPCKDNRFEQNKIYCPYCRLSTMQCICILNLKNCLKTDKPKFHDTSPSKISSQICTNYCIKKRKERKCRKTTTCCHSCEECKCRWCATRGDFSRIIDKCKCASQERCSNCDQLRNQCHCATLTLVKCHKNKKTGNRKRTMICLYCDNPRDKCTCRAPIGKCLYCGLPSDVCNCQGDKGHVWIAKRPNENRTICVTSWKPKREIRQYFERNYEDFEPYFTEEHQCCKKPKRQLPEELPYQRLNVFSEVINELQQKMCESVCCARCWRNPCCCGLPVDQDKRKEERKAENRLNYAKIERSSDSKSSNNYQYNRNSRNERKSTEKLIPIRHIGCVCKLTPCRYKKDRSNCKRPLAKCYYCKSLPCTCITVK